MFEPMARTAWLGLALAATWTVACGSDTTIGPTASAASGTSSSSEVAATSGTGGMATSSSTSSSGGAAAGGTGGGTLTYSKCYDGTFPNAGSLGLDYEQYAPVIGSHCLGTNHQDIQGVDRVVFLGDSVAVGTPPTLSPDFYRAKLADALAIKFGLEKPNLIWQSVNLFDGKSIIKESGDFASCAKWGARTDDLSPTQIPDCFSKKDFAKKTLVVITMGGNDLGNLTKDAIDGKSDMELWKTTEAFVKLQREAVEWIMEPGRFAKGVYVVFANMYEFTDGTGEVASCDVSQLAGFDKPVPAPDKLASMVIWANEQFLKIAVDNSVDMIFMLEEFCGHGFNAEDPTAPCYRGPGQKRWFDVTCTHPNPTGHEQIKNMYLAVIDE
jgi:hypothetical protein